MCVVVIFSVWIYPPPPPRTKMLPLAKLIQTGAQRVAIATQVRLIRNDWCKIKNTGPSFCCSFSSNHYRCFSASAAHCNSSSSTKKTPSYSYVIVGAGSAGCVLANRLTEDAHESVMLLEAGPKDRFLGSLRLSWKIHMPAALIYNLCDDKYSTKIILLFFLCVCHSLLHTAPSLQNNFYSFYKWTKSQIWCHFKLN